MAAEPGGLRALAPAKVNLALHVTGRRDDGYHLLESLVVFPETGDLLSVTPAAGLSLTLTGPFGAGLTAGNDNLVLRAARLLDTGRDNEDGRGAAITLDKRLPVASGIGGGSSDAATALRLLARLWDIDDLPDPLPLGADLPVCLAGETAIMRGIGEEIIPVLGLPAFWIVLVNPGIGVPTGGVFAGLEGFGPGLDPLPQAPGLDGLIGWLRAQRNDLEAPAVRLCPEVGAVLDALRAAPGVALARMSGSGATCFGICADAASAGEAATAIAAARPGWWVVAAPVAAGVARPVGGAV